MLLSRQYLVAVVPTQVLLVDGQTQLAVQLEPVAQTACMGSTSHGASTSAHGRCCLGSWPGWGAAVWGPATQTSIDDIDGKSVALNCLQGRRCSQGRLQRRAKMGKSRNTTQLVPRGSSRAVPANKSHSEGAVPCSGPCLGHDQRKYGTLVNGEEEEINLTSILVSGVPMSAYSVPVAVGQHTSTQCWVPGKSSSWVQ